MLHVKYEIRNLNRKLEVYLDEVYSKRLQLLENRYDVNKANIFSPVGEINILQIRAYGRKGVEILDFNIDCCSLWE